MAFEDLLSRLIVYTDDFTAFGGNGTLPFANNDDRSVCDDLAEALIRAVLTCQLSGAGHQNIAAHFTGAEHLFPLVSGRSAERGHTCFDNPHLRPPVSQLFAVTCRQQQTECPTGSAGLRYR